MASAETHSAPKTTLPPQKWRHRSSPAQWYSCCDERSALMKTLVVQWGHSLSPGLCSLTRLCGLGPAVSSLRKTDDYNILASCVVLRTSWVNPEMRKIIEGFLVDGGKCPPITGQERSDSELKPGFLFQFASSNSANIHDQQPGLGHLLNGIAQSFAAKS